MPILFTISILFLQSANLCVSLKETKPSHASQSPSCIHHKKSNTWIPREWVHMSEAEHNWNFPCIQICWNSSLFGTNNNNVNDQNFKVNFQYKEKVLKREIIKKSEMACSNKNLEVLSLRPCLSAWLCAELTYT